MDLDWIREFLHEVVQKAGMLLLCYALPAHPFVCTEIRRKRFLFSVVVKMRTAGDVSCRFSYRTSYLHLLPNTENLMPRDCYSCLRGLRRKESSSSVGEQHLVILCLSGQRQYQRFWSGEMIRDAVKA